MGLHTTCLPTAKAVIDNFVTAGGSLQRSWDFQSSTLPLTAGPDNSDAPEDRSRRRWRWRRGLCLRALRAVEVIDELAPHSGDYIVVKPRFSAYYGTNIEGILKSLGDGDHTGRRDLDPAKCGRHRPGRQEPRHPVRGRQRLLHRRRGGRPRNDHQARSPPAWYGYETPTR